MRRTDHAPGGPLAARMRGATARKLRFIAVRDRGSLYQISYTDGRQLRPLLNASGGLLHHAGPAASETSRRETAVALLTAAGANPDDAETLARVFARRILKSLQGDIFRLHGGQIVEFLRHWSRIRDRRPDLRTLPNRRNVVA